MNDRELLERALSKYPAAPGAVERLMKRKARKRRDQRIAAVIVAVLVSVATFGFVVKVFDTDASKQPAGIKRLHSITPDSVAQLKLAWTGASRTNHWRWKQEWSWRRTPAGAPCMPSIGPAHPLVMNAPHSGPRHRDQHREPEAAPLRLPSMALRSTSPHRIGYPRSRFAVVRTVRRATRHPRAIHLPGPGRMPRRSGRYLPRSRTATPTS